MKQLSRSKIILLLIPILSAVLGFDVDNLQYRQVNLRTGASASSTAQSTSSSTPSESTAASPSSVVDSSSSSPPSSSPSILISTASDVVSSLATVTLSSSSPEDAATSKPTSQASLTPSTLTNIPPPTAKLESSAATPKPVSSRTQQYMTTVVLVSGSTTHFSVMTTSALQAVDPTATPGAPKLGGSDSGPNNPGLEPAQKRLIIGVVVGVGGAILLGGLAVVAYRIWGKRRESADEDHELMDSLPGSSGAEKRSSLSGNSPFRSTLDQYHKPAGPVNTASNF